MKNYWVFILCCLPAVVGWPPVCVKAQAKKTGTRLVILGSGTPNIDPDRTGPSLAIIVNGQSYVVDCGRSVIHRTAEAARKGIPGLDPAHLCKLFITHLHSDHTVGYPDFILTPAVTGRMHPLQVYGPRGLQRMTHLLLAAYSEDINIRLHGLEQGIPAAYKVLVHETIREGIIYRDSKLVVKAFRVPHGSWPEAWGYRFETPDKIIVVSGDCTYSDHLVQYAKGCDILVHEVYSMEGLAKRDAHWQKYHASFHTSTAQLADIARQVHPRKLVLVHELPFGMSRESLLKELTDRYQGTVIAAHDLDIIE
ncbi:MAG TPA: MBL fold metallo-hydrolase [Sediminibacterium sp.]|nr:MBL fold metallo-hydrolase [Sediminibacterium sp.]